MGDRFCSMFPEAVLQSGKAERKREASQESQSEKKKQRDEKRMIVDRQSSGASSSGTRVESLTPALPGLRADAPGRSARGRGKMPDLTTTANWREEALKDLDADVSAKTTSVSDSSRWRTITKILAGWGWHRFHPRTRLSVPSRQL